MRAGDAETATAQLLDALRILHRLGDRESFTEVLAELTRVAILAGDNEHAAQLTGACDAICEQDGRKHEITEISLARVEIRRALGETRYEELHARGSEMSIEEALAYAEDSTRNQTPAYEATRAAS